MANGYILGKAYSLIYTQMKYVHFFVQSHFSRVQLFATLWAVVFQVPLSMGFSRQEYWSGLPFPSPGNLFNPGIEPVSPELQVDSLLTELWGKLLSYGVMLRPCARGHT